MDRPNAWQCLQYFSTFCQAGPKVFLPDTVERWQVWVPRMYFSHKVCFCAAQMPSQNWANLNVRLARRCFRGCCKAVKSELCKQDRISLPFPLHRKSWFQQPVLRYVVWKAHTGLTGNTFSLRNELICKSLKNTQRQRGIKAFVPLRVHGDCCTQNFADGNKCGLSWD